MSDIRNQVGDITKFMPGNEAAAASLESYIRADERRRCIAQLRTIADEYVEKWTPIIGADRAKACALDIESAAMKLGQP